MGLWSVAKLGWDGGRVKGHCKCLRKAGEVEGDGLQWLAGSNCAGTVLWSVAGSCRE